MTDVLQRVWAMALALDWVTLAMLAAAILIGIAVLARGWIEWSRFYRDGPRDPRNPSPERRLLCRVGFHAHSLWERRRGDDGVSRSLCLGCGRRMARLPGKKWRLEK